MNTKEIDGEKICKNKSPMKFIKNKPMDGIAQETEMDLRLRGEPALERVLFPVQQTILRWLEGGVVHFPVGEWDAHFPRLQVTFEGPDEDDALALQLIVRTDKVAIGYFFSHGEGNCEGP